jgi:type II secretory pathway predicted ATPase ExeA
MRFENHFGFTRNPFDKQEILEADAFESEDHKAMLNCLNFLKDSRGIGVFTARPGYGKTFSIRCFAKSLSIQLYRIMYICMSTVSAMDFYRQLCLALNLEMSNKKSSMFRSIQQCLLASHRERRIPYILVIDEAHHLNSDILQDLKMLMNFDYDSVYPFSLILIGEPHLNGILDQNHHEALRQRIIVHYDFVGMTSDETERYLRHKFSVAGASFNEIIGEGVVAAIMAAAKGNPRLIDNLMIQALTISSHEKLYALNTDVILKAANSLML